MAASENEAQAKSQMATPPEIQLPIRTVPVDENNPQDISLGFEENITMVDMGGTRAPVLYLDDVFGSQYNVRTLLSTTPEQTPEPTPEPNRQITRRVYYKDRSQEGYPSYNGSTITSTKKRKLRKSQRNDLLRQIQQYRVGEKLKLYPRAPAVPHSLPDLPKLQDKDKLAEGKVRNFNPETEFEPEQLAEVKVLEVIKGGIQRGIQLLLCEVLKAPTRTLPGDSYESFDAGLKVVLKVFDHIFFPPAETWDTLNREMKDHERADALLCRESNAFWHLYDKGLTGHPHPVPQYHGSWAMQFHIGHPPDIRLRCVGAILMEYIDGDSIENICTRERTDDSDDMSLVESTDDSDDESLVESTDDSISDCMSTSTVSDKSARLNPKKAFLRFPNPQDGKSVMYFKDRSVRLKVFRRMIDGCASFLHKGISRNSFLPRDIFLTLGNKGVNLQEPRVVFLDYTYCVVWSDTLMSKTGRADEYDSEFPKVPSEYLLHLHPLERLPRPPHPAWKFSNVGYFYLLEGWFPHGWRNRQVDFRNWLEEEFGKDDEKYSRYETLVHVLERAIDEAKREYLADTGKSEADLETGDSSLLREPRREEQRLWQEEQRRRQEAMVQEARARFFETKLAFEHYSEMAEQDERRRERDLQRYEKQIEEEQARIQQARKADKKRESKGSLLGVFSRQSKDGRDGERVTDESGGELNVRKTPQRGPPNDGQLQRRRSRSPWDIFRDYPSQPQQE